MGILGIDRTNCLSREKSKRYINIQYFLYENERLDRIAATTSDLPSNNNGLYNYIAWFIRGDVLDHPSIQSPYIHKERQLKASVEARDRERERGACVACVNYPSFSFMIPSTGVCTWQIESTLHRFRGKIRSSRGRGLRHPRDTGLSGSPVWASSTDVTALRSI